MMQTEYLRWVSFYVNNLNKVYIMSTDQKGGGAPEILGNEVWTQRFFYVYLGIKKTISIA